MQDIKEDIDAEGSRLLSTDALIAAATALGGFEASPSREPTTEFKREGDEVAAHAITASCSLSTPAAPRQILPSRHNYGQTGHRIAPRLAPAPATSRNTQGTFAPAPTRSDQSQRPPAMLPLAPPRAAMARGAAGTSRAKVSTSRSARFDLPSEDDESDDDSADENDHEYDSEEEEGLFVSPNGPTDPASNIINSSKRGKQSATTAPNRRVLGARGFANLPLPRDQDSDEEDLRPSHVLEQERLAVAGKPLRPVGARNKHGLPYGTSRGDEDMDDGATPAPISKRRGDQGDSAASGPRTRNSKGKAPAAIIDDEDDEFDEDFDGESSSSSGSNFGETPGPRRRSTNTNATRPVPLPRSNRNNRTYANVPASSGPRTPSPDESYHAYEAYGADLESPPPFYLVRSPGVIDRTVPYTNRPEGKFLSEVGVTQPEDIYDADDIFFTFKAMTAREERIQARLDAEKEAARLNALAGFKAPMRFDTCPLTAPVNALKRAAWIRERLRLDELEKLGDETFEDEEMDRVTTATPNGKAPGSANSSVSRGKGAGKRATCAGPTRAKRKYTWKDEQMKNKRAKGGVKIRSPSLRVDGTPGSASRADSVGGARGRAQVDGADEEIFGEVVGQGRGQKVGEVGGQGVGQGDEQGNEGEVDGDGEADVVPKIEDQGFTGINVSIGINEKADEGESGMTEVVGGSVDTAMVIDDDDNDGEVIVAVGDIPTITLDDDGVDAKLRGATS